MGDAAWKNNPKDANGKTIPASADPSHSSGVVNSILSLPGQAIKAATGLVTPQGVDTSALKTAQQKAADTQDYYHGQMVNLPQQYDPTQQQTLYNQGQDSIAGLRAAAAGTVPSAAEMQSQRQASILGQNQIGNAAAFQGRDPGAALRMATLGAGNIQANAVANGAAQRAQEQATARGQLVQAVGGQQQALQGVRTGDLNQQQNLITGDLGALNANANAAGAVANANAQAAASANAFKGGLINGGISLFTPKK